MITSGHQTNKKEIKDLTHIPHKLILVEMTTKTPFTLYVKFLSAIIAH